MMFTLRAVRIPLILAMVLAGTIPAMATEVRTRSGVVAGTTEDGIAVYKGIPYAAPTSGKNRWRSPQPVEPWTGIKQTTSFPTSCPQQVRPLSMVLGTFPRDFSEDCLYLNLWSPAASANAKLPVMVWFHGGGFVTGSANMPIYVGENLARKGVIVVTVNYRLGAFGFLAHPALTTEAGIGSSGNYGILDQLAALKWVRDNIAAFGGDPRHVTIFGESAGGSAVNFLSTSPMAKGLFQRLISESGPSFFPRGNVKDAKSVLAEAEKTGLEFFAKLGVSSLEEARQLPIDKVLKAAQQGGAQFAPIHDGVITLDPSESFRRSTFNDTPILIGNNSDEGALFIQKATVDSHVAAVRGTYGNFADRFLKAYPAATDKEAVHASRELMRDTFMGWSNWTWARLHAEHSRNPTYVYYFAHRTPWLDKYPEVADWGPAHASEIIYVFGTPNSDLENWSATDRALSEAMMTYWTNFAKSGDPNKGDSTNASLSVWPRFTTEQAGTMVFADKPVFGPPPNRDKMELIDDYSKSLRTSSK